MNISTIVTITDWAFLWGTWGQPGVRRIIDKCANAGMKKIYWRTFDGGKADYPSKIAQPKKGWDYDFFDEDARNFFEKYSKGRNKVFKSDFGVCDFTTWDALADAINYAHKRGIKIYAWFQTNEEDHGSGAISKFAREHPDCLEKDIRGKIRRIPCFACPETVSYKLSLIDEFLERGVDGIQMDFVRKADPQSGFFTDDEGVSVLGYNPRTKKEFRDYTDDLKNNDPEWISHRARYITEYMRQVKQKISKKNKELEISALVFSTNNFHGHLLDIKKWSEEKLVDAICPMFFRFRPGCKYVPSPGELKPAIDKILPEIEPNVKLYAGIFSYGRIGPETFEKLAREAEKTGVKELIVFESDAIERQRMWDTVKSLQTK